MLVHDGLDATSIVARVARLGHVKPDATAWNEGVVEATCKGRGDQIQRDVRRYSAAVHEARCGKFGKVVGGVQKAGRGKRGEFEWRAATWCISLSKPVMLFTSCTAAQARSCLEAVGGNLEQAASMVMDGVHATDSAGRRKM